MKVPHFHILLCGGVVECGVGVGVERGVLTVKCGVEWYSWKRLKVLKVPRAKIFDLNPLGPVKVGLHWIHWRGMDEMEKIRIGNIKEYKNKENGNGNSTWVFHYHCVHLYSLIL